MNRQHALLTFGIIFAACFAFALLDSRSVTYNCTWSCFSIVGKIAVIVAVMALIGGILTGLIRKKR